MSSASPRCRGAGEQQRALPTVLRERCGALEFRTGLRDAAELCQQIAADRGEKVVAHQCGRRNRIHGRETLDADGVMDADKVGALLDAADTHAAYAMAALTW